MDYRIKKAIEKNMVINTKTQNEYDELMKFLDKNGFEWVSGAKIVQKNNWEFYKTRTCIDFETQKELCYANAEYYQKEGYEIISYQEFINMKKDIEVIEKEDGSYLIQTPFEIEEAVQGLRHIRIYPKEEILDDVEKEYLRNVIKPFRNKVKCIVKFLNNDNEYIEIELFAEDICMPYFKKGTMYKGMEVNKSYTLEELGL